MGSNSKKLSDIKLSVLDLVPIRTGKSIADSFEHSLALARHVEQLGYTRYWMAEHHNMPGIASSATAVLIGHIAGGTTSIRVGSGGIMLPNHAPLIVAEQFGTLEALYPGRIDLGLGRAPGTDQVTAHALRRDLQGNVEDFPNNVAELQQYLSASNRSSKVRAIPGEGQDIPIWLLGSSTFGAQLAGMLGLPYAFASHFAPAALHVALKVYRDNFTPSNQLKEPYAMACVNVIAAETDEAANHLATSLYQSFLNVIRGKALPMQPPVESMGNHWSLQEEYAVKQMLRYTFVGSPKTIQEDLQAFLDETQVDEIMVSTGIYDTTARLRSYELLAETCAKTASIA
ncbi:LLM class flavin-dependent oxidoreductase [Pontibacter sp. JH31]|uniref:LLM class flavin-dependent oxidoreductase n=1 Tax=Pontibacter aquaedesilientis TaxID=2766980 RepID=A0ABR7XBL8_9BACT|nr:LLM class flavin-dependent oxidoreductase [Pontibacter aquaedesilientis]MBD1395706.1 LLM class flavin-dependent oxidoreductase [Pontibacter aquaedesilientis]